jgi:hypothetical protein
MWWKSYILSIIGCILFCGIILQIVSDFRAKKTIQLISGTVLAITLLAPLSSFSFRDIQKLDRETISPEIYIDMGRQEARNAQEVCIKDAYESYVKNKANELGMLVTVNVSLDEDMYPCFARIYAQSGSDKVKRLEEILEEDLGITKENQIWIWNQEKNSS